MKPTTGHVSEDRMIDLLNGLLTEEEARADFAHMKSCTECESRFAERARHHETLKARPRPVVGADGTFAMPGEDVARVRPTRPRLVRAAAIVAAVAAVAVWVVVPRVSQRSAGGLPEYWMPTADDERTIRAQNDAEDLRVLARGIEAYRERDLDTAVGALASIAFEKTSQEFDMIRRLYLASALVNGGRYQDATEAFRENWLPSYPHPWRQRARWVYYLANRGAGNEESADSLLALLVNDDGEIGGLARAERDRLGRDRLRHDD